jgi:DNA-binding NarL/FixJ family response regulator
MSKFLSSDNSLNWDISRAAELSSEYGILFAASTTYEAYLFALFSHHVNPLRFYGAATTQQEALDLIADSGASKLLCLISDGISNDSGHSIAVLTRQSNPESISLLIVNDARKFHSLGNDGNVFDGVCSAPMIGRGGLLRCIDKVLQTGKSFVDPAIANELRDLDRNGTFALTSREREALSLLSEGLTNRDIAERMFIAERTARDYVGSILSKLGLPNRASAASWAAKHGLAA